MDKLIRFIDCYVPITSCTLRCHYCYITHHRLFSVNPDPMPYDSSFIRKALSKERLGGTCLLNFCAGGETLLSDQLLDYIKVLAEEGHYIMIVTNGTLTKKIQKIASWPNKILSHIFFKFSYHYLQLKERKLLDTFFCNVKTAWDAGCSFTVEVTPSDELMPYVDECIDLCVKELGAKPHLTIARNEREPDKIPILSSLPKVEYYKYWGDKFDSPLFDFKKTIFEVKRTEFCYAGMYSGLLDLSNGIMRPCNCPNISQNIFQDISQPINWRPIGKCQIPHCYNGHSWIVLGNIPCFKGYLPTYAEERNRITQDGREWLQPEIKELFQNRMFDNNPRLSWISQKKLLLRQALIKNKFIVNTYLSLKRPFVRH